MTINYLKSIERGHIQTNVTHWTDIVERVAFYFFNWVFFLGFLLVLPTYMFIKDYLTNEIGGFTIIFGGTQLILGVYLFFCLLNWRRLTKIEGVALDTNKELIASIVNGYYPGLNYEWDGEMLIGSRPYDHYNLQLKGGLEIVLIFKDSDIYINVLSTYRPGPNPWLTFTNIDRAKEIGHIFKEKIRYRPNATQQNVSAMVP